MKEKLIKIAYITIALIGVITSIRIITWAIFSGYFLAKEGKSFWKCWGWLVD
jgi:uncharacterized membrane protein